MGQITTKLIFKVPCKIFDRKETLQDEIKNEYQQNFCFNLVLHGGSCQRSARVEGLCTHWFPLVTGGLYIGI